MSLLNNHSGFELEAGCDEAGRGCLAGPVFAAAVILPKDFHDSQLNDSKKLTEKQRDSLRYLIESEALAYAVAKMDAPEIDQYNILWASVRTMHKALDKLTVRPEYILVDGNKFLPYPFVKSACIIKGDGKYFSIAAASVLAKTYRDEYMKNLHHKYPKYDWEKNKGYPTSDHRQAIIDHGVTPYHRKTFKLLPPNNSETLF